MPRDLSARTGKLPPVDADVRRRYGKARHFRHGETIIKQNTRRESQNIPGSIDFRLNPMKNKPKKDEKTP
jgi:hypothetical protein